MESQGFFSTQGNRTLGALTLVMVMLTLASVIILNLKQADKTDMPATISVSGEGEVQAVPDIGTFSFSVEAEAETADAAQEASGTKINDILAYLKEQGIEDKDVKTANYNLYPNYRYEERICPLGSYCPPGERTQDGFTVSQTVTVKVRQTDKATGLIAGVGERGATNISGLSFTIDDTDALKAQAREAAIADARAKAEKLAGDLDVRIYRMIGYYENGGEYYGGYEPRAMMDMAESSAGFGGAELPMGEETTRVRVDITYEVK